MPKPPSSPSEQCDLLVLSCDAYSDLWAPFFSTFKRHWADCPFPVYLATDILTSDIPGVTSLKFDAGRDWSRHAIECLSQTSAPYVMLMLEDFFLRRDVCTADVMHCLAFAIKNDATQVRLIPSPGPTDQLAGENLIGESAAGSPYRLSTQTAIWNRSKLLALLRPGESAWQFEHNGNQRSQAFAHGFYATWRSVIPYDGFLARHVVEKGKWLPHEKWIFGRQGIGCDFSRRATLPWSQTVICQLARILDRLLSIFPWRMKVRIKQALKSALAPLMQKQFERMSGTVSDKPSPAKR